MVLLLLAACGPHPDETADSGPVDHSDTAGTEDCATSTEIAVSLDDARAGITGQQLLDRAVGVWELGGNWQDNEVLIGESGRWGLVAVPTASEGVVTTWEQPCELPDTVTVRMEVSLAPPGGTFPFAAVEVDVVGDEHGGGGLFLDRSEGEWGPTIQEALDSDAETQSLSERVVDLSYRGFPEQVELTMTVRGVDSTGTGAEIVWGGATLTGTRAGS